MWSCVACHCPPSTGTRDHVEWVGVISHNFKNVNHALRVAKSRRRVGCCCSFSLHPHLAYYVWVMCSVLCDHKPSEDCLAAGCSCDYDIRDRGTFQVLLLSSLPSFLLFFQLFRLMHLMAVCLKHRVNDVNCHIPGSAVRQLNMKSLNLMTLCHRFCLYLASLVWMEDCLFSLNSCAKHQEEASTAGIQDCDANKMQWGGGVVSKHGNMM